ncbi:hypothetical protein JL721_13160 [Aureococcus anophagefferens]|nr:hypothetical protein JL721_13160 [Aureococcus anophagefferens]
MIHLFVEVLDRYFGNVCELDIIFNFHKAYYILDELFIAGELEESSKRVLIDLCQAMAKDKASTRKPRRRNARARDDGGTRRATEATPPVRASKRLSVQIADEGGPATHQLVAATVIPDRSAAAARAIATEPPRAAAAASPAQLLIQFVVLPRKMGTGRDSLETDENVVTCFIDGAATLKRARKQGLLRPVARVL